MKQKTHSGAKKRFRMKASGKIKRGQTKMRHLMSSKNHKAKRHLGGPAYVNPANEYQIVRCLVP